jgi:hypothetical protein
MRCVRKKREEPWRAGAPSANDVVSLRVPGKRGVRGFLGGNGEINSEESESMGK